MIWVFLASLLKLDEPGGLDKSISLKIDLRHKGTSGRGGKGGYVLLLFRKMSQTAGGKALLQAVVSGSCIYYPDCGLRDPRGGILTSPHRTHQRGVY